MPGKARRGGEWSGMTTVELMGGIRYGNGAHSPSMVTLEFNDKISGKFIMELQLTSEQFLTMLRGSHMELEAEVAKPDVAALWGHVPVRDTINVPQEVTKRSWGDEAKRLAEDWFEDQPGSARFDEWWVVYDSANRVHRVNTITYVPLEAWRREQALTEESEDIDYEDDGLEDDDDG
jgi:hypothetical protein